MRGALILLPLLAACYTHAPIEPSALQAGTNIRARVNATTAEQLEPLLGLSNARLVSGVVITTSPDTLIVEIPTTVRAQVGSSVQTLKQRVAIPRASIYELETRKIDRLRTGLGVGSASLLAGALIFRSVRGGPGDDRPPDGGGPPEFRFPLLRIRM
ncbi:MAG: hypothetical protein H0U59_07750 [Gemmatimonadaceae bacterium]|nr:hypothetical protein [Gemmatimonadaceae bacterium]